MDNLVTHMKLRTNTTVLGLTLILIMLMFSCGRATLISNRMTRNILNCLSNNDRKGLKALFTESVRELDTLDRENDAALSFFDGYLISYRPAGMETR